MTSKYSELAEFYVANLEDLHRRQARLHQDIAALLRVPYPDVRVEGRVKSLYSTYLKLLVRDLPVSAVKDLIGLRVVVGSVAGCYGAALLLRRQFELVRGGIHDYIERPKSNGYRSLHVHLREPDGFVFEVQLRTPPMHATAERGTASHRVYKEVTRLPLVNVWQAPA